MQLSLEQAVGQKLMFNFVGETPPPPLLELLRRQQIAGITLFRAQNIVDPAQVRDLTEALQRSAADAGQPPLLIAADQEGGQLIAIPGTTPFPGNLALGAAGSSDLAYRAGYAVGCELAAMGVNLNYAPVADVNVNPRNPAIGTRSFGEDPALVARLSAAMIQGMQAAGVAATAKHFPGHGDTGGDPHYGPAVVSHGWERLRAVELPPFVAAVAAGVRLIMTAHVAYPGLGGAEDLPATLSPLLLRELLRRELGFEGLIVSDALDMAAIAQGTGQIIDTIAAVEAGVDLLLLRSDLPFQEQIYSALLQAARRGIVRRDEALASAARVLALKQWLASAARPEPEVIGSSEHQALAFEIAARALTLVRDDAGLLPLDATPETRIAVIAPRPVDLTPADTSSYEQCGLAEALRRYHQQVDEFLVPAAPTADDIAALRQRAADYDLLILGTINALEQPGQAALATALLECGVPLIVAALRMPGDLLAFPAAPTYLCSYSIQPPAMEALALALLGRIPCLGRLPVSIPGLYPAGFGVELGARSLSRAQ